MNHIVNRRAVRLFAAALLAVLLAGVAAACDEGGMYPGGSDSEPGWRR